MCIVCAFYTKKQTLIYDSKMVNKVKRKKFELSFCGKKVYIKLFHGERHNLR